MCKIYYRRESDFLNKVWIVYMTTLPAFKLFKVTTLLLFSHLHFIGIMQPKKLEFRKLNSTSQAYIRQPIGGQPKLLEYK